jgi:hypothetical protein
LLSFIELLFALVGTPFPLVCKPFALVSEPFALVSEPLPLVRALLALVRPLLPLVRPLFPLGRGGGGVFSDVRRRVTGASRRVHLFTVPLPLSTFTRRSLSEVGRLGG